MRNKIKELEQKVWFKIIEYVMLAFLLGFIVMQVFFPNIIFKAQLDHRVKTDENYNVLNEDYNIYTNMEMNDDLEELYNAYFNSKMKSLPLYENNYVIVVTDDVLSTSNPYTLKFVEDDYIITANTNKMRKSIILHKGYIASSFVHEVGHAVDNKYNFSKTEEFKALYDKIEHDDYLTSDIGEYFAEGYALFVNGELYASDKELIEYYEGILNTEYDFI